MYKKWPRNIICDINIRKHTSRLKSYHETLKNLNCVCLSVDSCCIFRWRKFHSTPGELERKTHSAWMSSPKIKRISKNININHTVCYFDILKSVILKLPAAEKIKDMALPQYFLLFLKSLKGALHIKKVAESGIPN